MQTTFISEHFRLHSLKIEGLQKELMETKGMFSLSSHTVLSFNKLTNCGKVTSYLCQSNYVSAHIW